MAEEEGRVLIVPPFNKKDIQDIAKESDEADSYAEVVGIVNTGITKGDIAIPAGGTKLYKHDVNLGSGGQLIYFSNKAKITTRDDLFIPGYTTSGGSDIPAASTINRMYLDQTSSVTLCISYFENGTTKTMYKLISVLDQTDTVTEL